MAQVSHDPDIQGVHVGLGVGVKVNVGVGEPVGVEVRADEVGVGIRIEGVAIGEARWEGDGVVRGVGALVVLTLGV